MPNSRRPKRGPTTLGIATIVAAAVPFVIYAVERWLGVVPDEATWMEQGWNHGPWRWTAEGFTILYPLTVLALITVILAVWKVFSSGKLYPILHSAALLAVQVLFVVLQANTLYWLID